MSAKPFDFARRGCECCETGGSWSALVEASSATKSYRQPFVFVIYFSLFVSYSSLTSKWYQKIKRLDAFLVTPLSSHLCAGASAGGDDHVVSPLKRLQHAIQQGHTQLLVGLMRAVGLDSINHENICCLNTTLLLLIFAHRAGRLEETLQKVDKFNDVHGTVFGKVG